MVIIVIAIGLLAYSSFRSVTYGVEVASSKDGGLSAGRLANLIVASVIALIALGVLAVSASRCYTT